MGTKTINDKNNSIKEKKVSSIKNNEELNYQYGNYDFKMVLSIPLILEQICNFIEKKDIKNLSLCNKKIYQLYCDNIKSLKINKDIKISNIIKLLKKYKNINDLDLSECQDLSISLREKNY